MPDKGCPESMSKSAIQEIDGGVWRINAMHACSSAPLLVWTLSRDIGLQISNCMQKMWEPKLATVPILACLAEPFVYPRYTLEDPILF